MYIQTNRSKSVTFSSLSRAILYGYVIPQHGFLRKLRERFGSNALLLLNLETTILLLLQALPQREPGMVVLVEARLEKRLRKIIERAGLKMHVFTGQRELVEMIQQPNIALALVHDGYSASHQKYKKRIEESHVRVVVYQNRKRPKTIDIAHDIYIWEPTILPRSVRGTVLVFASDDLEEYRSNIKEAISSYGTVTLREFIKELLRAFRGYENRYRQLDKKPPRILARLLYDMCIKDE